MEHFEAGFRKRHRLSDKLIIVVNGKGGVGKDTVCALTARLFYAKTISSITPVKEIAVQCGWRGEKDTKSRRFLADLKQLLIAYNAADDDVERYHYDYIFDNDCGQAVLFQAVERFMTALLRQEQLLD